MTTTTITKTVFFAAPRETVWAFITQKDKLALWFHPADADLAEGKDYALIRPNDAGGVDKQCWGHVNLMDAPQKLVTTFTVKPLNGAMTTVTWELEESAGGTRLTLTHEGIEAAAGAHALGLLTALDAGWDAHFSDLRKSVAA